MTAVAYKYEDLLTEVVPRPITNPAQHEEALAVVDRLMRSHALTPNDAVEDMIEVLATLIESYEREVSPSRKVTPIERLEHLLESRGQNRQDFAKAVGLSATHVSNILTGQRDITLEQARRFGEYFAMSPRVFLSI